MLKGSLSTGVIGDVVVGGLDEMVAGIDEVTEAVIGCAIATLGGTATLAGGISGLRKTSGETVTGRVADRVEVERDRGLLGHGFDLDHGSLGEEPASRTRGCSG